VCLRSVPPNRLRQPRVPFADSAWNSTTSRRSALDRTGLGVWDTNDATRRFVLAVEGYTTSQGRSGWNLNGSLLDLDSWIPTCVDAAFAITHGYWMGRRLSSAVFCGPRTQRRRVLRLHQVLHDCAPRTRRQVFYGTTVQQAPNASVGTLNSRPRPSGASILFPSLPSWIIAPRPQAYSPLARGRPAGRLTWP